MTINEIVAKVKPDYVSVNNPNAKGTPTDGATEVAKVEIEFDTADGVHMYITI